MLGLSVLYIVISNTITTFGGGLITGPAISEELEPFEHCSGSAMNDRLCLPALVGYFTTRFAMISTIPTRTTNFVAKPCEF